MRAKQAIEYIDAQKQAIEALVGQLDEIQVAFNAQYDEFKRMHDATLDALTGEVATGLDAVGPELRAAIEAQLVVENERIEERRQKLREEYLPQRQQAADELLTKAQAELAELRALNPELDEREETFKRHKADLEAQLGALNEEIRQKSRRFGVVLHFVAITKIDRERQRIIGKLEAVNDALLNVRSRWTCGTSHLTSTWWASSALLSGIVVVTGVGSRSFNSSALLSMICMCAPCYAGRITTSWSSASVGGSARRPVPGSSTATPVGTRLRCCPHGRGPSCG